MTGFSLGLVATLMWIAVLTGLAFSVRSAPRPADRSIREFRATRRQIAKVPRKVVDKTSAPSARKSFPPTAVSASAVVTRRAPGPRSAAQRTQAPRPSNDAEIDRLIDSLLSEPGPAPASPREEAGTSTNGSARTPPPRRAAAAATGHPVRASGHITDSTGTAARTSGSFINGHGPAAALRTRPGAPAAARFARTDGKLTYFVVDDEGRPQPNDH